MIPPCMGCKDRFSYCHVVCRAYKEWKAEKKRTKEENTTVYTQSEAARRIFWRWLKRR